MNIKHKIAFVSLFPFCVAFALVSLADFYTQEAVKTLAAKSAQQVMYGGSPWTAKLEKIGPQPKSLFLGDMLYANIYAQDPGTEQWWGAGNYTSDIYKNGWRTMLAKNPRLAYMANQKYGSTFRQEFIQALLVQREGIINKWGDGAQRAEVLNQFSSQKYWQDQRAIMDRYENLIQDLLSLSDEQLDGFIAEIPNQLWKGQETSALQAWFVDNGHLTRTPQEYQWGDEPHTGAWNMGTYPVDLLFLTHRVTRDYPDWTARKFLTEAKKFSYTVKTKLPR